MGSEQINSKLREVCNRETSPYLFVLVMAYLCRTLKHLSKNSEFNFHPRCEKLGIAYLSFADDLLLFARGDLMSVQLLHRAFNTFVAAIGLKENSIKCQVYFGGVTREVKMQILEYLNFTEDELPVRYLGVPLSTKKLSVLQCKPLIDKIIARITT